MRLRRVQISLLAALMVLPTTVLRVEAAPGVYLSSGEFLGSIFQDTMGEASSLVVNSEKRTEIEQILGHKFPRLRLRYWQQENTTAWILDEVGKTEPITIGVAIEAGKVKSVRILEFRESRGWEIRFPFFTDQFEDTALGSRLALDKPIDGITGATLSVIAVDKIVRVALLLDGHLRSAREADFFASN